MIEQHIEFIRNNPDDYQLIKRLQPESVCEPTEDKLRACFLDTETTGVDRAQDEMIELGYIIVEFTKDCKLGNVIKEVNFLNEPVLPIQNSFIHGITDDDVKGHSIDWDEVEADIKECAVCIAHNSGFDRRFVERYNEVFKTIPWVCTHKDVDWSQFGFSTNKLEFLTYKAGFFYEAHRAVIDTHALLKIVKAFDVFSTLLKAAITPQYRLIASGSPFSVKDELKARGYKPLYLKGKFVNWYTTVPEDAVEAETHWLKTEGKCYSVPRQKITALERYSDREEQINAQA